MISAAELTRALSGRWHGHYGTARCVVHDDRSPSLSIVDGDRGPFLKCFAGCDWRDIRAELQHRGLLDAEPLARAEPPRIQFRKSPAARNNDCKQRQQSALSLWREAGCIRETLAWHYLESRGIDVTELLPGIYGALRFHPSCPFGVARHPCMVGLFTDALTGQPCAIHRTALTIAGTKIDRKALGPAAGCVIRLWPDETVHDALVIGEGIETVLAAATKVAHRGTLLRPAWACTSANAVEHFPVLPGIGALTILVDNDVSRRGQQAAAECARRWIEAGRETIRLIPRELGADFNDIVAL
jgi:putative DNA primase/helicase